MRKNINTANTTKGKLACQDLQAEHMNMRIIDYIDYYCLMEGGPTHRLITVFCPLSTD